MAAEAEAKPEVGGEERWVGLAVDFSEGSRAALKWTADNLLRSGDNLLLLHVLKDPDYEQGETLLWEASGSRTYSALAATVTRLDRCLLCCPCS